MNNKQELTKEQQASQEELYKQHGAFEEMVRTKGWGYIQTYYQSLISQFVTRVLTENKPITEYQSMRDELVGLKKALGYVNSIIERVESEKKNTESTSK